MIDETRSLTDVGATKCEHCGSRYNSITYDQLDKSFQVWCDGRPCSRVFSTPQKSMEEAIDHWNDINENLHSKLQEATI